MFTGLIESIGKIVSINDSVLKVETAQSGVKLGDSIAINGICLTLTAQQPLSRNTYIYTFSVSPETLKTTSLKNLKPASFVNLERALQLNGRVGGHLVSGHVEAVTTIISIARDREFYIFEFSLPHALSKYMVYKGSIAIDGISLTISGVKDTSFEVAVIPHTFENTNLQFKKKGDSVNIESDLIAKYVEKLQKPESPKKEITYDFLKENGF